MKRNTLWRNATKASFVVVLLLAILVLARDLFGYDVGLWAPLHPALDGGVTKQFPPRLPPSSSKALSASLPSRLPPSSSKVSVAQEDHVPHHDSKVVSVAQEDHVPHHDSKAPGLAPCDGTPWRLGPIQVHVIAWQRPKSMEVLLRQLETASYAGWDEPVPLHIHMDGGACDASKALARDFEWSHGPKLLDIRMSKFGLRTMWLSSLDVAARDAGPLALMLIFEDDIRVSPLYFQWLLRVLDEYGRNPECRDANLVGISLSPLRMMEMKPPFTKWNPSVDLQRNTNHSVFLTNLASSWGASYFSDRWMEFTAFHKVRIQLPFYDIEAESAKVEKMDQLVLSPQALQIPDARSNVWPKSWKKFLIDLMYGRGTLMLYPNLPGERALATTMQFAGAHVKAAKGQKATGDSDAEHPTESDFKRNWRAAPLLQEFHAGFRWDAGGMRTSLVWPSYEALSVLDLWLKPTSREALAATGASFLATVNHTSSLYAQLVGAWARPGWQLPQVCAADLAKPSSHASVSYCT